MHIKANRSADHSSHSSLLKIGNDERENRRQNDNDGYELERSIQARPYGARRPR